MSWLRNIGGRLYRGEISFDFVGRQKLWYTISGLILVISIAALGFRGLHYSVDFKGGAVYQFPSGHATNTQVASTVTNAGVANPLVQEVHGPHGTSWQVQTSQQTYSSTVPVQKAIEKQYGLSNAQVSVQLVGPSWGSQITHKAAEALIAFLIVIVAYLTIAFEWRMAAAAFVALAHDIVITIGVYALTGFQVSPATVIGLLTILGYSLYDTVVVFDKVRENTAGLLATRRSNYSTAANLALNQTLVRSINTSLIALLPVTAILVVAIRLLGNGELRDLSLVLFVGMLSGTYSSICIATPVLAGLKERDPQYKQLAKQVAMRASGQRARGQAKAAAASTARPAGPATAAAGAGGRGTGTAAEPPGGGTAPDGDAVPPDTDERVPAASTAATSPAARPARPSRPAGQQPRRSSSARRRSGGKKKRR
jgi:preprotein translocase subunit SecF